MSTYGREITGRPDTSKLAGIASVVLTGTIAGFLIVSYIPGALRVDSRVVTIPFRCLMLMILFYAFYRVLDAGHVRMRISVTDLLVTFFWVFYCVRFIYDLGLVGIPLATSPSDMALYLFGICLPTFVVLYQIRDMRLYRNALIWSMLALGACSLASMFRTDTARDMEVSGIGYQGNQTLNHISYGHMGVTAMILGLFVLFQIGGTKWPWYLRLLAAGTVCLGIFSMLASGSRGAMVAGLLTAPMVIYLGFQRGSKVLTIGTIVSLGAVLSATVEYLSLRGMNLKRLLISASAYTAANQSVYTRQNMAREAWQQYLDHPWVGSSIVERSSLSYPHNAVLEAFMATGTFGGTAFVLLVLTASYRAIRLMRRDASMAWVSVCFFQYLIGAMFSGGLWGNPLLWGMMAIMLGVEAPRMRPEGRLG